MYFFELSELFINKVKSSKSSRW